MGKTGVSSTLVGPSMANSRFAKKVKLQYRESVSCETDNGKRAHTLALTDKYCQKFDYDPSEVEKYAGVDWEEPMAVPQENDDAAQIQSELDKLRAEREAREAAASDGEAAEDDGPEPSRSWLDSAVFG